MHWFKVTTKFNLLDPSGVLSYCEVATSAHMPTIAQCSEALSSIACPHMLLQFHCSADSIPPTSLCQTQNGMQASSLPEVLAQTCNELVLESRVCQGFVYDASTRVASFFGQARSRQVDLGLASSSMPATQLTRCTSPSTCNKPGCSMWLLNAGQLSLAL